MRAIYTMSLTHAKLESASNGEGYIGYHFNVRSTIDIISDYKIILPIIEEKYSIHLKKEATHSFARNEGRCIKIFKDLKINDLVMIDRGNDQWISVVITGDYYFDESDHYAHKRSIRVVDIDVPKNVSTDIRERIGQYYDLGCFSTEMKGLTPRTEDSKRRLKNFEDKILSDFQ